MRYLKIPLILLAMIGLIALAGCGGDDEESTSTEATTESSTESTTTAEGGDEYGQEVTTILTDFTTSFQSLGAEIQDVTDPEGFIDGVDALESELQTTVDDLSALEPPDGAADGQEQLVAAFEGFSDELAAVGNAVEAGDKQATKKAAQDLQAAATDFGTQLTEAAGALSEAGVTLGGGTVG